MNLNSLHNKHLHPGETPIMVSLDYIKENTIKEVLYLLGFGRGVDWYSSPLVNKVLNNTNPEKDSYVISEVSTSNKHSRGYYDCTGLVLIGKNAKGKNISLLTHQDPKYLFCRYNSYDCRMKFINDLQISLEKFKIQAISGTIDACIVGGNYAVGEIEFRGINFDMKQNYIDSIELLNEIIMKHFGFAPVVIGPILDTGFSDIFLDTKNRRIIQRRWKEEDFTCLENIIFQGDNLNNVTPELDEKCKLKQVPLWQILT